MSSYSLSNLSSNTKYGIAGFLVGGLGAYSLAVIWSDSGSSSSSSGSGYTAPAPTSAYTPSSSSSSMFGGATKHRRRNSHKKTRGKK